MKHAAFSPDTISLVCSAFFTFSIWRCATSKANCSSDGLWYLSQRCCHSQRRAAWQQGSNAAACRSLDCSLKSNLASLCTISCWSAPCFGAEQQAQCRPSRACTCWQAYSYSCSSCSHHACRCSTTQSSKHTFDRQTPPSCTPSSRAALRQGKASSVTAHLPSLSLPL